MLPAAQIVYPDAELLALTWLRARLALLSPAVLNSATVQVFTRVPSTRPDSFVQVRRSGGTASGVQDAPRLDVFVWHTSEANAMTLAGAVRGIMLYAGGHVIGGHAVYRAVEFMGPVQVPDTTSNQARVMFTVEWRTRGGTA